MATENLRDIHAFLLVARERSFTRAAVQLGVSQSALSHAIRGLEARMGLRLLTRTTRSVAPTEAGARLVRTVGPRLEAIQEEVRALADARSKPGGKVRITTSDFAAKTVLLPKLRKIQTDFPDIKIELAVDPVLADIVAEGYDASIRFGDQVAKDMTAVRISSDIRMVVVGAPSYFKKHPHPRSPADLTEHDCINLRFSPQGDMYAWEFKKGKRDMQAHVDGTWTFNSISPALDACLVGLGLAYMPEELARPHLQRGQLVPVMRDWSPTFPGMHICYSNRKWCSPSLSLVIDALRYDHKSS